MTFPPFHIFRILNTILMAEAHAAVQYRYQSATLQTGKRRNQLHEFCKESRVACTTIADHIAYLGGFPQTEIEEPKVYIEHTELRENRRMENDLIDSLLHLISESKKHVSF